jgi:hypothetical protein
MNTKQWWFWGCCAILCFHINVYIVREIYIGSVGSEGYLFYPAFVCCILFIIQCVKQFLKQRAQFSIRSVLLLTSYIAILCSIYVSLGLGWLLKTNFCVMVFLIIIELKRRNNINADEK